MSAPEDAAWAKVTSSLPTAHTVYWYRRIGPLGRLTVARVYDGDRWLPGRWRWTWYGPQHVSPRNPQVLAAGEVATVAAGRRAAEDAAGIRTPAPA